MGLGNAGFQGLVCDIVHESEIAFTALTVYLKLYVRAWNDSCCLFV